MKAFINKFQWNIRQKDIYQIATGTVLVGVSSVVNTICKQ